jgi:hypothetical protein
MAHFAKIENQVVTEVIVIANATINGGDFPQSEAVGQAFIEGIGLSGEWLQTSFSASFRGAFAGIGYIYDAELDEFIAPPVEE